MLRSNKGRAPKGLKNRGLFIRSTGAFLHCIEVRLVLAHLLHDEDAVGVDDGAQPVRDHDRCPPRTRSVDGRLDRERRPGGEGTRVRFNVSKDDAYRNLQMCKRCAGGGRSPTGGVPVFNTAFNIGG